jgi:hypothetical protein
MTSQSWLANRWLTEHETSREEVRELLALVERDLRDAGVEGLSADWGVSIAYNAALQLATLALAVSGYRAARERSHERVIQSLRFTIGAEMELIDTLEGVRRRRNLGNYERAGAASPSEAAEVRTLAFELRARVYRWLEREHANLLPPGQEHRDSD